LGWPDELLNIALPVGISGTDSVVHPEVTRLAAYYQLIDSDPPNEFRGGLYEPGESADLRSRLYVRLSRFRSLRRSLAPPQVAASRRRRRRASRALNDSSLHLRRSCRRHRRRHRRVEMDEFQGSGVNQIAVLDSHLRR